MKRLADDNSTLKEGLRKSEDEVKQNIKQLEVIDTHVTDTSDLLKKQSAHGEEELKLSFDKF